MPHRRSRALLSVLALVLALLFTLSAPQAHAAGSLLAKRICLDPGHGGSDPGVVNGSLRESDIVLDVAQALRVILQGNGAIVTMTRSSDVERKAAERVEVCNAFGAQLLISLHLGDARSSTVDGSASRYFDNADDKSFAAKLQAALKSPALGPLPSGHPFVDFGIAKNTSTLLRRSRMVAAQVEPVFLSDSAEAAALVQRAYDPSTGYLDATCNVAGAQCRRKQIANAAYLGLIQYLGSTP